MPSAGPAYDAAAVWDIASPSRPGRLPGVSLAGFRARATDLVDLSVVPYPAVTVVVIFGDGLLAVDGSSGRQRSGSVVAGLAPGSVRLRARGIECLQMRLSPVVAHAVLGASSELGGMVVSLDDLWGRDAALVQEQLRAAGPWSDRFAIAEAALARRHEAGRAVDPEVVFAWGQMVTKRGGVRVERLAAEAGWSRKRLWSRFRSQIGLTPKRAAQLIRFDHAAHRLAAGYSAAFVAAESGYADQSHLHRDVMAFAGMTPTAVAVAPWLAVDPVAWAAPEYLSKTLRVGRHGVGVRPVAVVTREHFSKTPGSRACHTASMSKDRNDFPLPRLQRPRYGVDGPAVLAVLSAAGVACCLAAVRRRPGRIATATAGTALLAHAGFFLHTTLRGKLRIWARELDRAGLQGNEQLLDLGCGRGAVLIEAARQLPAGHAVGVDLWSGRDQSGNSPEATLANAAAAGVADRVEVHTADMTALPFADGSFDVVTSALAIHNIRPAEGRYRAVDEAMRVLRPGGQLLVADLSPMARRYAAHLGQGTLRGLGPGYWYGGPWYGVTLLHAVKER